MEVITAAQSIFGAFGLSSSAGLNAYLPLMAVGFASRYTNLINLGENFNWLQNPWVLGILVVLSVVEFFADKIPAVNHANDLVQTVVRPAAGAILFAASTQVVTDINPIAAGALGLLTSGTIHTAKATVLRPAVTATTAGVANPVVSVLEDVISIGVAVLALVMPALMIVVVLFLIYLIGRMIYRRMNRNVAYSR